MVAPRPGFAIADPGPLGPAGFALTTFVGLATAVAAWYASFGRILLPVVPLRTAEE